MAISAISGGLSMGIGAAANAAFSAATTVGKALFQAGLHGIVGGIMSSIEGGSFESGFAAGAISSLVSSGISTLGETGAIGVNADKSTYAIQNKFGQSGWFKATMIASAGLSGGLSSSIAGGSFWAGARQGVIVATMNHLGHQMSNEETTTSDETTSTNQQQQDQDVDFDKLFDTVLKNKTGTTLTANDLVKKYGLSPKLNDAINSIKVLGSNKVYVDWKNEGKINFFSKLNIKDGILSLNKGFIPSAKNPNLGRSGYIITGEGLKCNSYTPVFVHNNAIYPYYPKTNSVGDGAKL